MKIAVVLEDYDDSIPIISKLKGIIPNLLFELRVDKDKRLLKLVNSNYINENNIILTLRSEEEGGESPLDGRKEKLETLIMANTKYIDLELDNDQIFIKQLLEKNDTTLIVSRHDFNYPMSDAALKFLADIKSNDLIKLKNKVIFKFVGKPNDALDTITSLKLLEKHIPRHIILGSGRSGEISRTLADNFNQELIYASTSRIPILNYDKIIPLYSNSENMITGLVGDSLNHSLSPIIHNVLRDSINLPGYYHLFEINNGKRVLQFIKELINFDIIGVNVTFPYKKTVLGIADNVSEDVRLTNAANTLTFLKNKIIADNTDVSGFLHFLKQNNLNKYSNALIFGAGGACRSVATALLREGFEITVVNRSSNRLNEFTQDLRNQIDFSLLKDYSSNITGELYINATPIGLNNKNPVDLLPFPQDTQVVVDLVYSKFETELIKSARSNDLPSFDGKEMLYHQAVDAFELWTRKVINRAITFPKFLEQIR